MRYLGIDYGTKRIGLALSDENGSVAFPKEVIPSNADSAEEIKEIANDATVGGIVIGTGESGDGEENAITTKIKSFVLDLEQVTEIPVYFEQEFFTSVEAHGRKGKEENNARQTKFAVPENLDAKAAALILQRFLDRENKKNGK